jgi:small-conductance mechanosensitive channel
LPFSSPEPTNLEASADPAAEFLLAEARKRLRAALEGLDQALSRHSQLALEQADQIAEYAALQEDRSRLAQELDAVAARERLLEAANLEAARRIERIGATVRAVIDADLGVDAAPALPFAPDSAPEPQPEQPETELDLTPGADPARES